MSIKQNFSTRKSNSRKTRLKMTKFVYNHRISFDAKGPTSPSSEGNSNIMVIIYAFTHFEALNPVPPCNAYYANITLCEHWLAKLVLPDILVSDNGTEFTKKKKKIPYATSIKSIINLEHQMPREKID